ncbi:uncharacterized protein LOC122253821 isoform X2 [Penaeus japonicus]|uniref:uncharacterized protein LOC122253821 isoform X2 n=1 Tax=Penaeus japonicus TaxID=27405 RepID=UPI001C70C90D|nr:uncharacterized protein LOC122253821 isoform X2 [Penaeus japonicus]
MESLIKKLVLLLLAAAVTAASDEALEPVAEALVSSDHVFEVDFANKTVLSPAEELILAAQKAGYNLTLERLDKAASSTDEEVQDLMPAPVAEAFIGQRRKDNIDLIREQMIGMIFTGRPQPLGHRPRRPMRNFRPHPQGPPGRLNVRYNPQEVPAPDNILKPLPFVPGPTMIQFPSHHPKHQPGPPPAPSPPRQHPSRQSGHRPRPRPPADNFKPVNEGFGNTVGPDFGPVTFNEFGGNFGFNNNFESDFNFNSPNPPGSRPPHQRPPSRPAPPPASRPAPSRPSRPSPSRPSPPRPSRPARPPQSRPPQSRPAPVFGGGDKTCLKYTEDICLDSGDYPHEAILSSLIRDPSRADTMMAEVRSQSADELVDGVSSVQEARYDFQHYFGNRRAGTENHAHRDFAQDGGYLCPSEVKYARPKRARNSKGQWKYIVNVDKYSQTIRMEKCMKPGGACSYVSHHYRATCNQVYNYHRLLSWEDGRGLHMDIFKVPSCCSCHIQGYAYVFPPLNRQDSAGSEQITTAVLPPRDEASEDLPPSYEPEDYPAVDSSVENNRQLRRPGPGGLRPRRPSLNRQDEHQGFGSRTPSDTSESSRRRGPVDPRRPHQRIGDGRDPDKVNYGYHPIIDFFSPYRLQSQSRK